MEKFLALILILVVTILFIVYAPRILTFLITKGTSSSLFPKATSTSQSFSLPLKKPLTSPFTPTPTTKNPSPKTPTYSQPPTYSSQQINPTTTQVLPPPQLRIYPVGYNYNSNEQYFSIYNYSAYPVNVTGFKVKSMDSEVLIPKATEKLNPSLSQNPVDIFLKPNETLIVSTKASPIGFNFKENSCLGYLKSTFPDNLNPPLNYYCPKPDRNDYLNLDPACISYIDNLQYCSLPQNLPDRVSQDADCVDYLNKNFNYGGCYWSFNKNADFFKGPWRVFLNLNDSIFRNQYERVILYDKSGKEMDRYAY